jgi:magnesium transporter
MSMLRLMRSGSATFDSLLPGRDWHLPADTVWIDLEQPSRDEELAVEAVIGLELPSREEMLEIEISSRLYQEDRAFFMTAIVLSRPEGQAPELMPVTFILAGAQLITIHHTPSRALAAFASQAERQPNLCASAGSVFLGLLDTIVDRTADALEYTAAEVEQASIGIFNRGKRDGFESIITQLGHSQMVSAKARESLVSLTRLMGFATLAEELQQSREFRGHLKSLQRDVQALTDHAGYQSSNITFLLDAALGLINIEQSAIIKIFSVASVVFLPPTLVASIYGMNFEHMPELKFMHGYPMALGLMVLSMVIPLWWFRRKGWL